MFRFWQAANVTASIFTAMADENTTVVVQRYLRELATVPEDSPAESIIRDLLSRSVHRLHVLCATLLYRHYPRLTKPPLNLQSEEMLSAVVDRMIRALRQVRPGNVRQFFALANQHMRWELNDLARKLDAQTPAVPLRESAVGAAPGFDSTASPHNPNVPRILAAIETLPEDERETFYLVRVQGMSQPDAADVLGVSTRTVQRRLTHTLRLLTEELHDLRPHTKPDA
jgi:RNA polymerase sigma-70 factor (ECF subfamily)